MANSQSEDDFVLVNDMSLDSGENFPEYVRHCWDCNALCTCSFV